jgi:hypothetical protein
MHRPLENRLRAWLDLLLGGIVSGVAGSLSMR